LGKQKDHGALILNDAMKIFLFVAHISDGCIDLPFFRMKGRVAPAMCGSGIPKRRNRCGVAHHAFGGTGPKAR